MGARDRTRSNFPSPAGTCCFSIHVLTRKRLALRREVRRSSTWIDIRSSAAATRPSHASSFVRGRATVSTCSTSTTAAPSLRLRRVLLTAARQRCFVLLTTPLLISIHLGQAILGRLRMRRICASTMFATASCSGSQRPDELAQPNLPSIRACVSTFIACCGVGGWGLAIRGSACIWGRGSHRRVIDLYMLQPGL